MDLTGGEIALVGTLCAAIGGAFGKAVDWAMTSDTSLSKEQIQMRQELREEVKRLGEQLTKVHEELEGWRGKYYELLEKCAQVKTDHSLLQSEYKLLQDKVKSLEDRWGMGTEDKNSKNS